MKSTQKTQKLSAALIVLIVAALTACGGGGGSSDSDSVPEKSSTGSTPVVAPVIPSPSAAVNPDLQTVIAPATYAAGSVERGAWDLLQGERLACGFGVLSQDTRLDTAAAAHAHYLAQISVDRGVAETGHGENSGDPDFTGANPGDRVAAAGFPSSASLMETLSASTAIRATTAADQFATNELQGQSSMRNLMGTVYHLSGALFAGRSAGVGADHQSGAYLASPGFTLEAYRFGSLIASIDSPQVLGTGVVATYPCERSAHATTTFYPAQESPNPFPDITDPAASMGTPIYFKADDGSVLVVTDVTVTSPTGEVIGTKSISNASDAASEVRVNEYFVIPVEPLVARTTYTVVAVGTLNGSSFTRTFSFTPQAAP